MGSESRRFPQVRVIARRVCRHARLLGCAVAPFGAFVCAVLLEGRQLGGASRSRGVSVSSMCGMCEVL